MFFYIITTIVILLGGFYVSIGKNKPFVYMVRASIFLYLTFFSAARYDIGTDYAHYLVIFESIKKGAKIYAGTEPLFYYLIRFCTDNGFSFQIFVALCSIITNFFFLRATKNKTYFFQLIIYYTMYYVSSFCLLRQMMGLAFTVYAFSRCEKNKFKCLLFILLACLVHRFFWLVLLGYVLSWFIKFTTRQVSAIVIISFFVFVPTSLLTNIITKVLDSINFNVGLDNLFFATRIGPVVLIRYLYTLCFYIVFMHNRSQNYTLNFLFLAVCLSEIGGTKLIILATRLALCFYSAYFLMMSDETLAHKLFTKTKRVNFSVAITTFAFCLVFLTFFTSLLHEPHFNESMPYKMLELF